MFNFEAQCWLLAFALILDAVIGDPDTIWRRYPHPVVWFGKLIDWGDASFNDQETSPPAQRGYGLMVILGGGALMLVVGLVLSNLFNQLWLLGWILEIALVSVFLASRSLSDHVMQVVIGLRSDGLKGGRAAVAMIVGRDVEGLDESGVAKAAIESLAENFSDGVVAPAFWYGAAGLPGILAYKFINTADSMIGHKNERYLHFGRAAAIVDDLANWIPARLSVGMVSLACFVVPILPKPSASAAVAVAVRDAGLHRSPNAGWPEAAFAGALDIQLGGPRTYGGEGRINIATLNSAGRFSLGISDIERALPLMNWARNLLILGAFIVALTL